MWRVRSGPVGSAAARQQHELGLEVGMSRVVPSSCIPPPPPSPSGPGARAVLRGLLEGRPGGGHGGTRGEAGSGRGLGAGERWWRSSAIPGRLCLIPSAGVAGQVRPGSHLFTEGGVGAVCLALRGSLLGSLK